VARPFTSALHIARHLLMSGEAWLMFVQVARKAGGFFRLVGSARHVVADGKVWQAAGLKLELPGEEAEGSLGDGSITLADVSRLALGMVEVGGELIGQEITVWVQHESTFASFDPAMSYQMVAKGVAASGASLSVECGSPEEVGTFPLGEFTRQDFPGLLPTGVA